MNEFSCSHDWETSAFAPFRGRAAREAECFRSFRVENSKLKSVPPGTVKPKENCWTPKGPFPTIMRILSGRFKFFEKPFRNVCANDGF